MGTGSSIRKVSLPQRPRYPHAPQDEGCHYHDFDGLRSQDVNSGHGMRICRYNRHDFASLVHINICGFHVF